MRGESFQHLPLRATPFKISLPRPEARPDLVCFPWGVAPAPRQVATTITTTACHNRLFHGGFKSCWGACQAWVGGIHACRLVSFFVFGDPKATRVRQRQELVVRMGTLIQPRTSNEANREGHQRILTRTLRLIISWQWRAVSGTRVSADSKSYWGACQA